MALSEQVKNEHGPATGRKALTFDEIKEAPSDLIEGWLEIPEWGGEVRLRSLTAAQSTMIRQEGLKYKGDGGIDTAWERMETLQVTFALQDPNLSEEQVRELRLVRSASGFQKIVDWVDEKSGLDKEELRRAQQEFQRANDAAEAGVPDSPGPGPDAPGAA